MPFLAKGKRLLITFLCETSNLWQRFFFMLFFSNMNWPVISSLRVVLGLIGVYILASYIYIYIIWIMSDYIRSRINQTSILWFMSRWVGGLNDQCSWVVCHFFPNRCCSSFPNFGGQSLAGNVWSHRDSASTSWTAADWSDLWDWYLKGRNLRGVGKITFKIFQLERIFCWNILVFKIPFLTSTNALGFPVFLQGPKETHSMPSMTSRGTFQRVGCNHRRRRDVPLEVRINGDRINGVNNLLVNGIHWGY